MCSQTMASVPAVFLTYPSVKTTIYMRLRTIASVSNAFVNDLCGETVQVFAASLVFSCLAHLKDARKCCVNDVREDGIPMGM